MAGPQHKTPQYRHAYHALKAAQAAGQWLVCVEPQCVEPTRAIAPWQPAHVSHDPTGAIILGPSHQRCNITEVNERRRGKQTTRRLAL